MSSGDKILMHPDRNEIEERLLAGESVRSVSAWLKKKYPKNKEKQISYLTLQRYRKQALNLQGEVLSEIKQTQRDLTIQRFDQQNIQRLKESSAYDNAKLTIAQDLLERNNLILELHDKAWDRLKLLEQEPLNYKTEEVIVKYIDQLRGLLQDHHKMLMDFAKHEKEAEKVQATSAVAVEEQKKQIEAIMNVVKEVLTELDPGMIPIFVEKVKEKAAVFKGLFKTPRAHSVGATDD